MPIILPANSAISGGFNVSNSVMFEQADDPYFQKTPTGDGNQRTFTFSVWLKMDLHDGGDTHKIFDTGSSTNYFTIYVTEEPFLRIIGRVSSSNVLDLTPTQSFRDPTAWFHLYIAIDTTQGTASNRAKVYINGSQVTSFATATYPNQNTDFEIQNASYPFRLGADKGLGNEHYDGYMAEYMFVDGAAQDIGDFGEFDEDSPAIWKPKNISAINVNPADDNGNGFYLDFKDSSNLGNDVGVNAGTDFSENNIVATDQSTDTCTNNGSTFNPLDVPEVGQKPTLSIGNLQGVSTNGGHVAGISTIGLSTGKWYAEFKASAGNSGSSASNLLAGIMADPTSNLAAVSPHDSSQWYGARGDGTKYTASTAASSWGGTWAIGDIIGLGIDLDNNYLYISKNGQWSDGSGNYDEANPNAFVTLASGQTYFVLVGDASGALNVTWQANFGYPSFAVSSGNADGNGYGNFEFAVPANYYAINTKNLAEYG